MDVIITNLRNLLNRHHGPHTGGPGSWGSYYRNIRQIGDYVDHNSLVDRASISHINHIFGPVEEKQPATNSLAALAKWYDNNAPQGGDNTDYVDANS